MESHADAVVTQREVARHAGLYLCKNRVDPGDHDRVAGSGNGQAAKADPTRAFQLQRVGRLFVARAANVHLAFVDRFEAASFEVQHAAGPRQEVRIGLLV